jgi:predicted MFS family arabinose efflux permease
LLLAPYLEVWVIVLLVLLLALPSTVFAVALYTVLAEVIPSDRRNEVVGKRNALMSASMMATTLICGQLLDLESIQFPANYQMVFIIGAAGVLMSTFHIGRIQLPQARVNDNQALTGGLVQKLVRRGSLRLLTNPRYYAPFRILARRSRGALVRLDLLRSSFGPLLGAYLFFYIAQFLGIPLFPLYFVRDLELTDSIISIGTGLFNGTVFLASLSLTRFGYRFTQKQLLYGSSLAFGIYPLLIGLARGADLYLWASALGGLVWGISGVALVNRLMEIVPDENRPAYMALHNLALNLGILGGSLMGPLVSDWIGLREAMFVVAGARTLAGLLLLFFA